MLIAIADQISTTTAGLIDELIDANECGVAVEMLSDALIEADAVLAAETVAVVERLVETMGLGLDVATRLRPLVHTIGDHTW